MSRSNMTPLQSLVIFLILGLTVDLVVSDGAAASGSEKDKNEGQGQLDPNQKLEHPKPNPNPELKGVSPSKNNKTTGASGEVPCDDDLKKMMPPDVVLMEFDKRAAASQAGAQSFSSSNNNFGIPQGPPPGPPPPQPDPALDPAGFDGPLFPSYAGGVGDPGIIAGLIPGGVYFPVVEKIVIFGGGALLIILFLCLLTKALSAGGLIFEFGKSLSKSIYGDGGFEFHASGSTAGAIGGNAQLTSNVLKGVNKQF